jgi:hypothetical protein
MDQTATPSDLLSDFEKDDMVMDKEALKKIDALSEKPLLKRVINMEIVVFILYFTSLNKLHVTILTKPYTTKHTKSFKKN